ncbi:FAD-dependent oxidoreductase [Desulfotomaculum defluvii]
MKRLTGYILLFFLMLTVVMPWPSQAMAKTSSEETETYDLIVVGSDPEGIAAAISGARNGLSTLLIDTRPEVGGLFTRGWLNVIDMNMAPNNLGNRTEVLNKGIFLEFYKQIGSGTFDVHKAQEIFEQMLDQEEDLELCLGVKSLAPVMVYKKGKPSVDGVKVENNKGKSITYIGKSIIDATQDADLAAAAGVPFSVGQEDSGYPARKMATTLVFKLDGITTEDWQEIRRVLTEDNDWFTGANNVSAWGFGPIMEQYQASNQRVGIRGLNMGRQKDGTVLINALHIFDVDPLDLQSRQEARRLAEKELPLIIDYLRENIPGLQNCFVAEVAPELYIRESRHIYGEYRLTIDDVLENKDFSDRIAFGSYAVDVQASGPDEKGAVMGVPAQYAIPFRCLVPQEIDNLLVVGRSASFDSLPHGSARTVPVGMATGEAAGVAAALSIEEKQTFREISKNSRLINQLQEMLNSQGMDIKPFTWRVPDATKHWAYDALKMMRKHALVQGGYSNDYQLDQIIIEADLVHQLQELSRIYGITIPEDLKGAKGNKDFLSGKKASLIIAKYEGQDMSRQEAFDYVMKNYGDKNISDSLENKDGRLTRAAAYVLLQKYVEKNK